MPNIIRKGQTKARKNDQEVKRNEDKSAEDGSSTNFLHHFVGHGARSRVRIPLAVAPFRPLYDQGHSAENDLQAEEKVKVAKKRGRPKKIAG